MGLNSDNPELKALDDAVALKKKEPANRNGRVLAAGNVPVFSEMVMRKGSKPTALIDVPLPK